MLAAFVATAISLGTGAHMCDAITPADLAAVGLKADANHSKPNVPDPKSAYCVYAGRSSATGGIEFDVFDATGDVKGTWATMRGESQAHYTPLKLAGADQAEIALDAVSGGPKFAVLDARRGGMVFDIGVPAGPKARMQLITLAKRVLARVH